MVVNIVLDNILERYEGRSREALLPVLWDVQTAFGHIDPEAVHLGEPTNLWKHLTKYFEYGRDFAIYRAVNPMDSKRQLRFLRPVYLRNWRRFLSHPLLGGEFVAYSALKFAFGGAGLVLAGLRPRAAPRVKD